MIKVLSFSFILIFTSLIFSLSAYGSEASLSFETIHENQIINNKNSSSVKDITKIKNLYKCFINISITCVNEENLSSENIKRLNYLIDAIKYYQKVYTIKYSCLFNSNKLEQTILNSKGINTLISNYVFYTNRLSKLKGCEFVNL